MITTEALYVYVDQLPARMRARDPQHETNDRISDGRQYEWSTQGSADTNALRGCIVAKHHSDKGDDTFWERRAEGREDRTHRVLRHADLASDPLDAVDEILTGSINEACGNQQEACG